MTPATLDELRAALAGANQRRVPLGPIDLRQLSRVIDYTPEDMTITVEAGATLDAVQQTLATHKQWLPLDPPNTSTLRIGELLAQNISGPRRLGFGTVRDYVIGLSVLIADGRVVTSGGRVVKNVAGYDLAKLFVGGRHSLGLITQVTFKVRPRPESEQFLTMTSDSPAMAGRWIDQLWESPLRPVVMDLHRLTSGNPITLVVGFSGSKAEVDWQLEEIPRLGISARPADGTEYWDTFWQGPAPVHRWSVLPSQTIDTLQKLGQFPFVAHAGNGIIYVRGGPAPPTSTRPQDLLRRLKETFDPQRVLPDF